MAGKFLKTGVFIMLLVLLGALLIARSVEPERARAEPSPAAAGTPPAAGTPAPSVSPAPGPSPTPEPYADRPDIDISAWEYTLVNGENPLPADYIPQLRTVYDGQSFDVRAADALEAMVSEARAAGLVVYITSSYRAYAAQEYLFGKKVSEYVYSEGSEAAAVEKAKTIVAYPGTSEHQLGLACDLVDQDYAYMDESLEYTALSVWLAANCAEYGFILRYPKDKTALTGVMFEPWHFRYVGEAAAAYIMSNGLALEEFVALY
ncbi:MAG: M15 family metallopeptidase [Oscillospiraceae bacterium]|jgi:D-alanyl-D-alanine carboxypeptidase|nr:M15 family metallopeptidase [Oscillospiraceae bacterium]